MKLTGRMSRADYVRIMNRRYMAANQERLEAERAAKQARAAKRRAARQAARRNKWLSQSIDRLNQHFQLRDAKQPGLRAVVSTRGRRNVVYLPDPESETGWSDEAYFNGLNTEGGKRAYVYWDSKREKIRWQRR